MIVLGRVISDREELECLIAELQTEASSAGDHAMALICRIALRDPHLGEGLDHLHIWGLLSPRDRHRIGAMTWQDAWDECLTALTD